MFLISLGPVSIQHTVRKTLGVFRGSSAFKQVNVLQGVCCCLLQLLLGGSLGFRTSHLRPVTASLPCLPSVYTLS